MLQHRTMKGARRVATGLAVAMMATGVAGCETTAYIVKQIRELNSVRSTGVIGDTCDPALPETEVRLRFTAADTTASLIEPGTRLVGATIELGETFSVTDIEVLNNTGTLYPSPDVSCSADSDCAALGGNFTCAPLSTGNTDSPRVCGLGVDVNVNRNRPIEYIPEDPRGGNRKRDIILLAATGSSILGVAPNGRVDRLNFSSDPQRQRTTGILTMLQEYELDNNAYGPHIEFCAGTYLGSTTSVDFYGDSPADCFSDLPLPYDVSQFLQFNEAQGPRNYWAALLSGIEQFGLYGRDNVERHIVLFTDGDISADIAAEAAATGQTFERVRDAAIEAGVHVNVIQLDNPRGDAPATGALAELSQLACETDGTFNYVQDPRSLVEVFRNLGNGLPASYEGFVGVSGLATQPIGGYTLAFTLQVTMNEETKSYTFGGDIGTGLGRADTRVSVFNRGSCGSDEACLPGYACVAGACVIPANEGSGEGSGT